MDNTIVSYEDQLKYLKQQTLQNNNENIYDAAIQDYKQVLEERLRNKLSCVYLVLEELGQDNISVQIAKQSLDSIFKMIKDEE